MFKRPSMNGPIIDTNSLKGRVYVVKFFAKYCEPCRKTLPAVQRLHEKMPDLNIIGLAEDDNETDALEVINLYHLSFPVVFDLNNSLAGRFHVKDMPTTVVIDANGVIRWVARFDRSEDDLLAAINAVQNGQTPLP